MVATFDIDYMKGEYNVLIVLSSGKASEKILLYCPHRITTIDHVATVRRLFETYGKARCNYRIVEGNSRCYVTLHDKNGSIIMEGAAECHDTACYTVEKCIECALLGM